MGVRLGFMRELGEEELNAEVAKVTQRRREEGRGGVGWPCSRRSRAVRGVGEIWESGEDCALLRSGGRRRSWCWWVEFEGRFGNGDGCAASSFAL